MIKLIIGYILLTGVAAMSIYLFVNFGHYSDRETLMFSELPIPDIYLVAWGSYGGLSLWIWMIIDFFKSGTEKNRIAWGLSFLIFNIFTSIIYFISIYSIREYRIQRTK